MIEFNPQNKPTGDYNPISSFIMTHTPPHLASSIRSEKKGGAGTRLFGLITTPIFYLLYPFIKIATWVKNTFFCCFAYSGSDSLNWQETKDVFEGIYTAVCTSKHTTHSTTRQKQFLKQFKELSHAAQERFRQHIGFVLAEKKEKITDRVSQMKWYQDNPINDSDYFENIENNDVLKQAVKAFHSEITEKTAG